LDVQLTPQQLQNRRNKQQLFATLKAAGYQPYWRYDVLWFYDGGKRKVFSNSTDLPPGCQEGSVVATTPSPAPQNKTQYNKDKVVSEHKVVSEQQHQQRECAEQPDKTCSTTDDTNIAQDNPPPSHQEGPSVSKHADDVINKQPDEDMCSSGSEGTVVMETEMANTGGSKDCPFIDPCSYDKYPFSPPTPYPDWPVYASDWRQRER
jgi:hypothetical protein